MKKSALILLLIGVMLVTLTSCGTSTDATEPAATTSPAVTTEATPTEAAETTAVVETTSEDLPLFTADELAKFDGKDGNAAYVGYEGKVYDVTDIPAWKDGIHQGKFNAGQDLTDELNNIAPHAPTFLTDKAPVVGRLE